MILIKCLFSLYKKYIWQKNTPAPKAKRPRLLRKNETVLKIP